MSAVQSRSSGVLGRASYYAWAQQEASGS